MSTHGYERITANGLHPYGSRGAAWSTDERPPREAEVEFCIRWLRTRASPTKTIRRKHSSYWLKHCVEAWSKTLGEDWEQMDIHGRAWSGSRFYVSNGAFLEAARREGYRIIRDSPNSLNGFLNLTIRRAVAP